ncbi:hypothetical protein FJK98_02355 [Micromonospora sp. HM134]|uniref:hypothetical protein n=1 Tax=Micromonospora sp. HM134 TaxID=2583243 RepID=UPI001198BD9C|nr:hypothetical protein [Micromonospora sp. HM134]QDY06147.1 hypothetical protein FJK98_02355 [Micromonospora sp. HM134]
MTAPVCATPDCGRPAVAAVTTTQARISVRTDRLDDPATAAAWAEYLRCWWCATAAVDQHIAIGQGVNR